MSMNDGQKSVRVYALADPERDRSDQYTLSPLKFRRETLYKCGLYRHQKEPISGLLFIWSQTYPQRA
jgi:hypothetical protein